MYNEWNVLESKQVVDRLYQLREEARLVSQLPRVSLRRRLARGLRSLAQSLEAPEVRKAVLS
ncbi:hypothetical protein HNR42_002361 [Deinobacterium chartae]|uniref:Uncharacterized protein n=1 Tax=Deinobacterium chartae TaxID=521158 RepID=A0A841I1H7_9DEIO|nr:hypothetical protein [Deinobacterium chartae]MBB6098926.1 hypothetical protein [Deinobacterium chartae]